MRGVELSQKMKKMQRQKKGNSDMEKAKKAKHVRNDLETRKNLKLG